MKNRNLSDRKYIKPVLYKFSIVFIVIAIVFALILTSCTKKQTPDASDPSPDPTPELDPEDESSFPAPSDQDEGIFFTVTEHQLLPPTEQSLDAGFEEVYGRFVESVHRKDLSAIGGFLDEEIKPSFGRPSGISEFYEFWGLNETPEQSELWAELEKIIALGGTYDKEEHRFTAPYVFSSFDPDLDAVEYCVIVDKDVAVYEQKNTASSIIEYLNYNLIVWHRDSHDISSEFWNKADQDLVKIETLSGNVGYVQKKYIRSPMDYRFGFQRNDRGEWKMIFMVAGD